MDCDPASSTTAGTADGPQMNLVVGSQHHFVRMANDAPTVAGDAWTANVTVQNLTLQPFGTKDGTTPWLEGVRVFFVDEPSNGVEIFNYDGAVAFTGSDPQKYYEYAGTALGEDGILGSGETSAAKSWQFTLNGATEFSFSVLIATEVPDPTAYAVHLTRVSPGGDYTCGDGSDGKAYCWGIAEYGLGVDTITQSLTPLAVSTPESVTLSNVMGGFGRYICAEGSDGNAYCWGLNNFGMLGNGTTTNSSTPVAVSAPAGVTLSNVMPGNVHACAEGSDDKIYCWGSNWYGQLGSIPDTTFSTTPVAVSAPEGVTLSNPEAGTEHTCAEGSDGNIYCWGRNTLGALGDGTTSDNSWPVMVQAPEGVTLSDLAAGGAHTCALGSDGNTYCWGKNEYGQLGDGTSGTIDHYSTTPAVVAGTRGP